MYNTYAISKQSLTSHFVYFDIITIYHLNHRRFLIGADFDLTKTFLLKQKNFLLSLNLFVNDFRMLFWAEKTKEAMYLFPKQTVNKLSFLLMN